MKPFQSRSPGRRQRQKVHICRERLALHRIGHRVELSQKRQNFQCQNPQGGSASWTLSRPLDHCPPPKLLALSRSAMGPQGPRSRQAAPQNFGRDEVQWKSKQNCPSLVPVHLRTQGPPTLPQGSGGHRDGQPPVFSTILMASTFKSAIAQENQLQRQGSRHGPQILMGNCGTSCPW